MSLKKRFKGFYWLLLHGSGSLVTFGRKSRFQRRHRISNSNQTHEELANPRYGQEPDLSLSGIMKCINGGIPSDDCPDLRRIWEVNLREIQKRHWLSNTSLLLIMACDVKKVWIGHCRAVGQRARLQSYPSHPRFHPPDSRCLTHISIFYLP